MSRDLLRTLEITRQITKQAADKVSELYIAYQAGASADTVQKGDDGPVTIADRSANSIILAELRKHFPTDAILSEEDSESWITSGEWTWMVDPLDGTKEYLSANGEFMVMVGLCHRGIPVVGVVREPATGDELYAAKGHGAWRVSPGNATPVRLKTSSETDITQLTLAVSRSHRSPRIEEFEKLTGITKEFTSGSVGRKIALVTTGQADLYLHPSPGTKLWDSCAPQIILEEAGGKFTDGLGNPIRYARPDGDVKLDDGILAASAQVFDVLVSASRQAWLVPMPERKKK